ncbi:MAG: hypothetical protein IJH47_05930 [Oscillospiraceae bacterium]|nr:hypothetical protein [Oscillospiraceae bacterium]
MSFTKITAGDVSSQGVQSLPNKLTGTPAQNKAAFDNLVNSVVKEKFNALIDELLAATAAGQIGVDTIGVGYEDYDNLQDVLEAVVTSMASISQGGVADGAVTTAKLDSKAVTTAKIDDEAVTAAKLDPALTYAAVGLSANQVRPIYVTNTAPTGASPDGIYLVYE